MRLLVLPQAGTAIPPLRTSRCKEDDITDQRSCGRLFTKINRHREDIGGARLRHLLGVSLPVVLLTVVASFMFGFDIFIKWSHSSSVKKFPYLRITQS